MNGIIIGFGFSVIWVFTTWSNSYFLDCSEVFLLVHIYQKILTGTSLVLSVKIFNKFKSLIADISRQDPIQLPYVVGVWTAWGPFISQASGSSLFYSFSALKENYYV